MMKFSFSRPIANLVVLFLLGIFLAGTTGLELIPTLGVLNGKRVLEVFTLLLLLSAVMLNRHLRTAFGELQTTLPPWALIALALAFALGSVSALRFPHPGYGLLEIALPVLLILCVIGTAAAQRTGGESFDRLALLILIAIGVIAIITELTGLFASWSMGAEFSNTQMLIRFAHPRFYNQLQTFSIPLIVALPFIFKAGKKLKFIAVVLLGLQWYLVLVSGGRGTMASLIAAFVAAAFLFPSNRRAWLSIHFAGLLLGVFMFLGVLAANQSFAPEGGKFIEDSVGRSLTDSTGRVGIWRTAWREALEQPLLGSGPARFACEALPTTPSHPHNFPIRLLAEWGFAAFALFMAVITWLGWSLIMKCRRCQDGKISSDVLVAMLGCSILAATLHALVSGVLIMPASQLMAVLIGGWTLGKLNVTIRAVPASAATTFMTLAAGLVLAVSISVFSVSEVQKLDLRNKNPENRDYYLPRYWQFGRSCKYSYENH